MPDALTVARYAVLALFAFSVMVATGSWLVRTRRVSPFSQFGRSLRSVTDPIVRPVEKRLVRLGGNPVNAGWWLVVVVAAGGVVFISVLGWALSAFPVAAAYAAAGPVATLALVVEIAYKIIFYAVIVRVVASWLGYFQYARWLRPVYALTDWLVVPVRRFVPPMGMIDISPLIALVILYFLKWILLSGLRSVAGGGI